MKRVRASGGGGGKDNDDNGNERVGDEEQWNDSIHRAATRIALARLDRKPFHVHVCNSKWCYPMSEYDLIGRNLVSANDPIVDSSVYVCRYGQIHVCTPGSCTAYLDSHTGTCPLTGVNHGGSAREDTGYVPPEKRTAHARRGDRKTVEVSKRRPAMARLVAAGSHSYSTHEIGSSSSTGTGRFNATGRSNAFSAVFASGASPDAALDTSDVQRQIKGEGEKDEKREQDRKEEEDEKQEDRDEEEDKKPKRGRKRSRKLSSSHPRQKKTGIITLTAKTLEHCRAVAEEIVTLLFFSSKRRQMQANRRAQIQARCDQEVKRYYDVRAGVTFPIATDVLNIVQGYKNELDGERDLVHDPARVHRYVTYCIETWKVVINSPWGRENPGAKFETHVLALLYRMRRGSVMNGVQVIASDTFMLNLPNRIDLPMYGERFESGIVTNGTKNLIAAYQSEIDAGTLSERLRVYLE